MDARRHVGPDPGSASSSLIRQLGAAAIALVMTVVGTAQVVAQTPGPSTDSAPGLAGRLPARIADASVRVDTAGDLGSWIDEAYQGEPHPEVDALDSALAAQGLTRADIPMIWASAGDEVQVTGFGIPHDDAQVLREAILAVYFLGFEDLTRTEQEVDGHPVTVVSQGPLESDDYPFGVVTDRDTLWVVSAERNQLQEATEALVRAATGAVPRYDASVTPDPGYVAPWGWDGTMSQTITLDKGAYAGTAMGRLTGSWVMPLTTVRHCEYDDCTAYIPTGTIDWSWDVSAPTRPPCSASTHGSLEPGAVVVPSDQMLFLDPTEDGHVRFWGSGTLRVPDQPCTGWEGARQPGSFFSIPAPEDGDPFADESNDQYPSCGNRQWRIAAEDTRISGRCWNYRDTGYEDVVEWDLVAIDG